MLTKSTLNKTWLRITLLVATFFCLTFLFVSPAVKYADEASVRDKNRPINSPISGLKTEELIRIEFQKGIDEIKLRLEEQNSWYHYKFILIGGMFALFLGQSGFLTGYTSTLAKGTDGRSIEDVLTSTSNYSILALAVVVALGLDMHIRNNMFGNQTIGLWIANYVEPSYPSSAPYFPWEQFLRNVNSPRIPFDSAYKLGFSVQLHFMTIATYLVYIIVFQQISITSNERRTEGQKQIILFGFVLVHLSAFAFVFITRAVSGTYKMNLIPFATFANGWWNIGYYLIPLVFLMALSLPYLLLLRREKRNDSVSQPTRSDAEFENIK